MTIYTGFSHWKWWFSIAMLVYQRVICCGPRSLFRSGRSQAAMNLWRWEAAGRESPGVTKWLGRTDWGYMENWGMGIWLPSGELTFCHGKSPFLMGKSTISMAIFNGYVSSPEGIQFFWCVIRVEVWCQPISCILEKRPKCGKLSSWNSPRHRATFYYGSTWSDVPSGYVKIAIEHGHRHSDNFPWNMVLFHSYVTYLISKLV